MKRDMDLCRKMLLAVESESDNSPKEFPFTSEYDDYVINGHIKLLGEAGLIDISQSGNVRYVVSGLTWAGHDFLDAARDEGRWARAKQRLADAGVGTTFTLLKETLEDLARKALGLGD